jgi:hypothetical protein
MKMIRVIAKQTERRDQRLESVIAKYPSLQDQRMGLVATFEGQANPAPMVRSYVAWMAEDGVTLIDIEVGDEAIVERLASELRACGCVVRVYTEKQYDELSPALVDMFAEAKRFLGT